MNCVCSLFSFVWQICHLQVDLDDSVKLLLLHVEQEVVLSDAGCGHAHRGRLEVPSLQRETRRVKEKRIKRGTLPAAAPHTWMLVSSCFTLSFDDTSTTAAVCCCPLRLFIRLLIVSLADSSLMSATTTDAPSEAKRWHTARPIPLPPPGNTEQETTTRCAKVPVLGHLKFSQSVRQSDWFWGCKEH